MKRRKGRSPTFYPETTAERARYAPRSYTKTGILQWLVRMKDEQAVTPDPEERRTLRAMRQALRDTAESPDACGPRREHYAQLVIDHHVKQIDPKRRLDAGAFGASWARVYFEKYPCALGRLRRR